MHESLVVTLIGADRPGIVAGLAKLAAESGAGWQESKMARLAGRFAGIVRLDVPEESREALEGSLRSLRTEGLQLTIERGTAATGAAQPQAVVIDLIGHDRHGIVRDISAVLTRHGVTIDELDTDVRSASMSGEQMFHAHAHALLPEDVAPGALRADLEAIADELMVELSVDSTPAGQR